MWDVGGGGGGSASLALRGAHQGHVTALKWLDTAEGSPDLFVSGGQDGAVCVWDARAAGGGRPVARHEVHANERGAGAVGNILPGGPAAGGALVTSGADMTVQILDPAASFAPRAALRLTDFPYTLAAAGGLALAGCGDGALHVIDIAAGRTLYALGAGRAAVRAIEADANTLLAAGDDGNALLYRFGDVALHR